MKCSGCGSEHVNLDETWSQKGSLIRGTWAPFRQCSSAGIYEGFDEEKIEGFCASCMSNNSRNAFSWTPVQQVSPHHQIWNKIIQKDVPTRGAGFSRYGICMKEKYSRTGMVHNRLPGDYAGINQTWGKQPRYTLG